MLHGDGPVTYVRMRSAEVVYAQAHAWIGEGPGGPPQMRCDLGHIPDPELFWNSLNGQARRSSVLASVGNSQSSKPPTALPGKTLLLQENAPDAQSRLPRRFGHSRPNVNGGGRDGASAREGLPAQLSGKWRRVDSLHAQGVVSSRWPYSLSLRMRIAVEGARRRVWVCY